MTNAVAILSLSAALISADGIRGQRLTVNELHAGWIQLFDGESLFGWQSSDAGDWNVHEGVLTAGTNKPSRLCTTSEFADYVLRFEFRASNAGKAQVILRSPPDSVDGTDYYAMNVGTAKPSEFPIGSFHNRAKSLAKEVLSGWQAYQVTADSGHFVVTINGEKVLDYTDQNPTLRGFIAITASQAGAEFRNIKLLPRNLKSLFNGRDLQGWRPFPGQQSKLTVTEAGELHLQNGRGQAETIDVYGDFALQLQACLNGRNLNSGVFFRCIPGDMLNGYECQLDNRFKDGDRTQPIDYGTGGIYRRQAARRVISDDQLWFSLTVMAASKHMAAWVNGYQVSDWTDDREPNENPRNGVRTAAGTIALQGHDQTTDLLFRDLRAKELPYSPSR